MNYAFHIGIVFCTYLILSSALNIATGHGGLVSLCQAAFSAIGAYAVAIGTTEAHWGFFPAMGVGLGSAALLSGAFALAVSRLRGDFFVLCTLGLQTIALAIYYNWDAVTHGAFGIAGIPAPSVFGTDLDSPPRFFGLAAVACLVVLVLVRALVSSPFGRSLHAVRDDELAASAIGKRPVSLRVSAFAWAGALAAVAGALQAGYVRYVDPTSFNTTESLAVLSIVVIGGSGNLRGPVLGTALLVGLPDALRFLKLYDAASACTRQILFGLAIVLLMRLRPGGLTGDYEYR